MKTSINCNSNFKLDSFKQTWLTYGNDNDSLIDKFRKLKDRQINVFENALKTLEQVNNDVVRHLCSLYRANSHDNREIRSLLYLIKQLLFDSQNKFNKNMNETNCLAVEIEQSLMDTSELPRLKETIEALKLDRRRLKCEKLELLNQTKELYKTIESKEQEMRDFLRHYETKTKETSYAVRRLIEHKADVERERVKLQQQNIELLESNTQMKFLLESKDATINKLQKQLQDLSCAKHTSARYSFSKDSVDFGYSSGKSRDTLATTQTTPSKSESDEIFLCETSSSSNNSLEHTRQHTQETITTTTTTTTPQSNRQSKSIMTESMTSHSNDTSDCMRASLPIMSLKLSPINDYSSLNQLSTSLNIPPSDSLLLTASSYSSSEDAKVFSFDQPVDKWSQNTIKEWLESIGMQATSVKTCLKYVKNGRALLSINNDQDLDKIFFTNGNSIHKRKVKLALDELKSPEKIKFKKLSVLTLKWICNTWLMHIGLKQYQSTFKLNLIDGRLLASLQRKDLEKYFGIKKRLHQTSILIGIELLKKYDFDIEHLHMLRQECEGKDLSLWTNENVANWLKELDLQQYVDNLDESGIHGALLIDSSFSLENFYELAHIDDTRLHAQTKKLIEDEFKILKKSTKNQQTLQKSHQNESVFMRSLSTFKNDKKIFTFRGSLGRALGKKMKREISSPLIDDDTYKRIEYNHKIVDIKNYSITSAV